MYNKFIEIENGSRYTAVIMRKECFRMTSSDYITIPLSKTGKYAGQYEAIVSPEDNDLAQMNWSVSIGNWNVYAYRKTFIRKDSKTQRIHTVVMERILGRDIEHGEYIDHINGDGLDNRRENLRLATASQNAANQKTKANNTSGYKGITWNKQKKKWHARIMVNGKQKFLGYFDKLQTANEAYCKAAQKYFGEFANCGDD